MSPEQVDIVERALAKVDRVGFDPDAVDQGEELLAGWAAQFGPKDLRRLAEQVVDAIDPDGTLPDERLQPGSAVRHPAPDAGTVGTPGRSG